MGKTCECCDADVTACSMCTKHYCFKSSESIYKEDHEEILKNKSQYCVQCSYKKFVSVDHSSHTMLQKYKVTNNKRQRRHSWHCTLSECDFSEFENNCASNEVLEEVRLIMFDLIIKKTGELLALHADGFEKIHSFKNKISKKFLFGDIKNAYTYLHNFISASVSSLNIWLGEIESAHEAQKERLKSNPNNSKHPQKKMKFNLSLKKLEDDENLDDSDNGKDVVNGEVNENLIKETIREIEETSSNDSIYSQVTQEICANVLEFNVPTETPNILENISQEDADCESIESDTSFVFNIKEFQNDQNEFENNLLSSSIVPDEQNEFCNYIASSQTIADDQNKLSHSIEENVSNERLAYQTDTQECSSNSLLGKDNIEIQKINILRSLGLKSQNDDLDYNEELRIHEIHMNRLLQNIEDEPLIMSEEESFDDDLEDEGMNEYIKLPEGIYGKITNTLPSLPTATDSPTHPINENCDTYENYNLKDCWVVLEKLVEPKFTDDKRKQMVDSSKRNSKDEIDRLLDIDSLEKKRKNSSSKRPYAKKMKQSSSELSPKVFDLDSDSDNDDNGVHSNSNGVSPNIFDIDSDNDIDDNGVHLNVLENIGPSLNNDTSEADFLENLLSKILDDKDDTRDEPESVIEDKKHEKRKPDSENENNEQNNKENEPERNDAIMREKKVKTDAQSDWKSDPLLRFSLRDTSEAPNKKIGTMPEALKTKILRLEARMLCPGSTIINSKKKETPETEKELDGPIDIVSDIFAVKLKCNEIIVNSESDSDIEYVPEKNESKDSEKMKGRKNIREILGFKTLTRATKRAHTQERERKNRLNQKQKTMDAILSQSQYSEDYDGFILDVDENTKSPIVVIDPALSKKLKSHQKAGVKFMWDSCYEGVQRITSGYLGSGCILAHCMGLGKTLQVVTLVHTLFSHEITKTKYVLVVCPLSVVPHWEREFNEATKNLKDLFKVFCISNRQIKPLDRICLIEKWRKLSGVLIMGYESYQSLVLPKKNTNLVVQEHNVIESLCNPGPDLVILDEGHLIKNEHTFRAKALRNLKTKRRIVLTGTPLQNNLIEYYHMIQFVKPNLLGSLHEYQNRFSNPITNGQYHDSTEQDILKMKNRSHVLNNLLKGTVQRFELSELVPYLKKRHDYALFVQPSPLQMNLYEQEASLAESNLRDSMVKKQMLTMYNKFKYIWSHPYIFRLKELAILKQNKDAACNNIWWNGFCPPDSDTNVNYGPKFKIMLNIVKECDMVGDKVLIFSNSLLELDAIEHFLQQESTVDKQWVPNEDYIRMDGNTSAESRVQLCDSFNDKSNPRKRVFLISNKVGGMGLNLMGANRVILMNVNWNPADDSQSVFRIYRFGQEKECFIYRLVSMGTMEEVIYDRQVTKLATSGRVIDLLQITRHFKSTDLRILLRPKFIRNQVRPTPQLPADCVLAQVLQNCTDIFRYHEHQSLLQNLPDENLNEHEMKLAWDEFNKENENAIQIKKKITPNANATVDPDNPSSSSAVPPDTVKVYNGVSKVDVQAHLPIMSSVAESNTKKDNVIDLEASENKLNSTKLQVTKGYPILKKGCTFPVKLVNTAKKKIAKNTIKPIKKGTPINDNIPIINLDAIADNAGNHVLNQSIQASTSKRIDLIEKIFKPVDNATRAKNTIINLDDTSSVQNNQQALILALNKNLDITVSAMEKQQTGEIIEID